MKMKHLFLLIMLFFLAQPVSAAAPTAGDAERQELLARQKQAAERIGKLKTEQDRLLFQKAMYEADSKYLLIDLASGKGQLKYRNRVLRTFSIKGRPNVAPGLLNLTSKQDGSVPKRALVFGDRLALIGGGEGKGALRGKEVIVPKKDLAVLFYILEPHSPLYIVN